MSALGEYVKAVARQYDLLEYASSMDSAMLCATRPEGDHGRHWTRQDARRLDYEREIEEADFNQEQHTGRRCTRTERILRRWPSPDHRPALREAQKDGTYAVIAPLVVALSEAHRVLRRHYSGKSFDETWDGYSTPIEELERTEAQHSKALALLIPHLLDVSPEDVRVHRPGGARQRKVTTSNDARDKWLYDQLRDVSITSGEILAELARLSPLKEWKYIGTPQGIFQAANRWAERKGKPPLPRRKDPSC